MGKNRIAIFASGTGSNAINLINFFEGHSDVEVAFVLSNNEKAAVLVNAGKLGVKTLCFKNSQVADGAFLKSICQEHQVDWIVLAGYLRLIPSDFIRHFSGRIINLHPSLLPNYGGKGMFGRNVHEAVLANNEKESGITIHFVNEQFDEGRIIAQFHCAIDPDDTITELEGKIRKLEQGYLPIVVQNTILN